MVRRGRSSARSLDLQLVCQADERRNRFGEVLAIGCGQTRHRIPQCVSSTVPPGIDPAADTPVGEPEPWEPEAEPHGAGKVLDAWGGLASDLIGITRSVPGSVTHPVRTLHSVAATAAGAVRFTERLRPTSALSIEGPVGPHRVWAHSSASLDDVKTIRQGARTPSSTT